MSEEIANKLLIAAIEAVDGDVVGMILKHVCTSACNSSFFLGNIDWSGSQCVLLCVVMFCF